MRCCIRSRRRSGFTLLEVVIGTVLLATLVTTVVMSVARHQRKIRFARQRTTAISLADQLIMRWQRSADGIPLAADGYFADAPTLTWRTRVIQTRLLCEVPVHVVRLEMNAQDASDQLFQVCAFDLVADAKTLERAK